MGQKPSTPREGLDRARALIASGRVYLAAQELSYVDRAGSRADAAEAQELFGDLLFRNEQYERAGDVYMRAYKLASLPKVRLEGIALKAAFAYYHAQSPRISDVFDAAGPQFLRVVKTASSAGRSITRRSSRSAVSRIPGRRSKFAVSTSCMPLSFQAQT